MSRAEGGLATRGAGGGESGDGVRGSEGGARTERGAVGKQQRALSEWCRR